jgi:hypothetical protein
MTEWLTFLVLIQEVSSSILSPYVNYSGKRFCTVS